MHRREFITLLGGAITAWPQAAPAQQGQKVYRVGVVFTTAPLSEMVGSDPIIPGARAIVHGLRDLGYVEGRNLVLERRSAEGRFERIPEIVAEVLGLGLDAIILGGINDLTIEFKRATSTVPIVMTTSENPVESGIVASLAHPGGNVTGLTRVGTEIDAKRLQMLQEAIPSATRVAFLGLKSDWESPGGTRVQAAARALGVTLFLAEHTSTRTSTQFADAFAVIDRERPHALFAAKGLTAYAYRLPLADFAVKSGLPSIFPFRESVEAGGLMSYGEDFADRYRRATGYVDKILKGAKPRRPADSGADQVRSGNQPQDGEGARGHNPAHLFGACR
jgi:putative ABC transport system substrate-binding protein